MIHNVVVIYSATFHNELRASWYFMTIWEPTQGPNIISDFLGIFTFPMIDFTANTSMLAFHIEVTSLHSGPFSSSS